MEVKISLKKQGKGTERTNKRKRVPHSLGKNQPLSFIDLPHQNHMVL
jgi:hypothetical protein